MNILVTLIFFILTITWSLAYGCGQQQNQRDKKCRQIDDDFDGHGDAAVQCKAHRLMEHIQASLEATGPRHWASACVVLPRQPPW
jgi:hypothetical protein